MKKMIGIILWKELMILLDVSSSDVSLVLIAASRGVGIQVIFSIDEKTVYRSYVRQAILYESETCCLKESEI